MKSPAVIQAAIVMLLIASAASCEVAKEYSTRVFNPTIPQKKPDSSVVALKFMDFDSDQKSDSIDLKEFFAKNIHEKENPEPLKDTVKTETAKDEVKNDANKPIDATKRNTTRSKKVRQ